MKLLTHVTEMENDPIIVMGMHRSGTSFFVTILESLNIFMGNDLDSNNESKFFCNLNSWIMGQASSTWDRPHDLDILTEDENIKALVSQYITSRLRGISALRYSGVKNAMGQNNFKSRQWGWKDPRNTFTHQFWLDLYPKSKIIILERNGLDVANSLITRRNKAIDESMKSDFKRSLIYSTIGRRQPFGTSAHLNSVEKSAELWLEYLLKGRDTARELPDSTLTICYEDFLDDPYTNLSRILTFIERDESVLENASVVSALDKIDKNRKNAFKAKNTIISEKSNSIFSNY